ncbi:hypothetical protein PSEUBRA_002047 [Kalmanozyma brasiliensis GHG001]|uniref:uncharacterized protein n=1 Tax=Kalmanozyma brasiliensis (strain GHG001) TaxID=1365824 RepID=UPI001CEA6AFC|nr:uncharacterized protein PSEUBRA_002047 [Kalmanozyma brasiliensis GHG001]EST08298.2 hypothetical protein PSEUBRA_002047 [Kalmanozyma brasiliensis GHG001]
MLASTSMPPHSSSGSGSSTPWLSPEASSSAWRGSYSTSSELSRSASLNASMNASLPSYSHNEPHSQEWWEHVLPPGQLAERLRKAQRSSNASRRRNNPALANATPSERSAWKRLSGLPTEKRQHTRSESSTATSSRRSSFQGGAAATLPRSALKSSLRSQEVATHSVSQSESSADVSSDELGGTSTGQHSPEHHLRFAFPPSAPAAGERDSTSRASRRAGVRTSANSPEMVSTSQWTGSSSASPLYPDAFDSHRSFSRSSGVRRMRVMSEDGMASTLFASVQSSSASGSYRLPASQSVTHLNQHGAHSERYSNSADHLKAKLASYSLPETPELSSDDAADVTTFSTTTTQRVRKTSTTKTTIRSAPTSKAPSPPTILRSHFDRPDQPASTLGSDDLDGYHSPSTRRDRHVSFDSTAATASDTPTRANVRDYPEPLTSSQSAYSFGRDHTGAFDSLPPRSNSTRRSRQGVRVAGHRATSFSLPSSRRGSIREDSPFQFGGGPAPSSSSTHRHRRTGSIPDAVLIEGLHVAHKQLASAGHMALTLTRQLSAPLRPVFHMTLFLSISSITVLSLACFLCASYMLTAWDDVSVRTNKVREVAGRTKHRFEGALDWGRKKLGPEAMSGSSSPRTGDSAFEPRSSSGTSTPAEKRGAVSAAGHAFTWPARMAFSGAATVAHHVTPPSVSKMFEQKSDSQSKRSTLPPRPPLSTLLPSILFTLLLAIGAGLTSFLASRKEAGPEASPQAYTVPLSPGTEYISQEAKNFHSMRAGMGQRRTYVATESSGFVR